MNTAPLPKQTSLSTDALSVRLAKPPDIELAEWMSQLRTWFDQHGIQPACFKYHGKTWEQTYEVGFRVRQEADLFSAEFTKPHLR